MIRKNSLGIAALLCLLALFPAGCEDSASGSGSGSASGGNTPANKLSGPAREAADAAMAEVARHCVKGPDGWTTACWEGTSFAPIEFVRQFKMIAVKDVESYPLGDSDRMNGFTWAGEVHFMETPGREAGDIGYVLNGSTNTNVSRQKGRWSQWVQSQPFPVHVQKQNGKWHVDADTTLLHGRLPTTADYAKAGVK